MSKVSTYFLKNINQCLIHANVFFHNLYALLIVICQPMALYRFPILKGLLFFWTGQGLPYIFSSIFLFILTIIPTSDSLFILIILDDDSS